MFMCTELVTAKENEVIACILTPPDMLSIAYELLLDASLSNLAGQGETLTGTAAVRADGRALYL